MESHSRSLPHQQILLECTVTTPEMQVSTKTSLTSMACSGFSRVRGLFAGRQRSIQDDSTILIKQQYSSSKVQSCPLIACPNTRALNGGALLADAAGSILCNTRAIKLLTAKSLPLSTSIVSISIKP